MKLSALTLRNFRKYEGATFAFHNQFNVLIGNNGAGKTTVLDAIAIMLNTYFQGSGIITHGGNIKKEDARFLITEKGDQTFRETQRDVCLHAFAKTGENQLEWLRHIGDRGGKAKDLIRLGSQAREKIRSGQTEDLPLFLYYGAQRLWSINRKISTEKPGSQLDAYRYCLDPKSDQKAFEKWFKKLSYSEIQRKRALTAVYAIRETVLSCTPGATDFYFDMDEDQILIHLNHEGWVPFNSLSDGYRNMIAMVADIAHRAVRLNPHLANNAPQKTEGIVLIDEIDLHLHPKWQRSVVSKLKEAFPRFQFIATTHSPFILQSLSPGEVIDLEQPPADFMSMNSYFDNEIAGPGPGNGYSDRPLEDIIEEIMGIATPQRSHRLTEMYAVAKEYYKLLEQADVADPIEKEQLKQRLDELTAPYSDNVAYHAFLEMERRAKGLGSSNKGEE